MLDLQPTFRPVRRLAGYLPLEDLGLIGDGATAALVGLDGSARVHVSVEPRRGAAAHPALSGLEVRAFSRPDIRLHLRANRPLPGLQSVHELAQGDRLDLALSWGRFHRHHRLDVDVRLRETAEAWRQWMTNFRYDGPQEAMVRRAAITLKLCDQWVAGDRSV